MKKDEHQVNLLELVPVRMMAWEKSEEGSVTILKPKFRGAFFKKHLLPRMKRPHYKVKLDDKGSFIWSLIDGRRNVQEIGDSFLNRFGDAVEPLYNRLSVFFQQLERGGFIRFKNL